MNREFKAELIARKTLEIIHLEKLGIKYLLVKLRAVSELPETSGILSKRAFLTLVLKSKNCKILLFSLSLMQKLIQKNYYYLIIRKF